MQQSPRSSTPAQLQEMCRDFKAAVSIRDEQRGLEQRRTKIARGHEPCHAHSSVLSLMNESGGLLLIHSSAHVHRCRNALNGPRGRLCAYQPSPPVCDLSRACASAPNNDDNQHVPSEFCSFDQLFLQLSYKNVTSALFITRFMILTMTILHAANPRPQSHLHPFRHALPTEYDTFERYPERVLRLRHFHDLYFA